MTRIDIDKIKAMGADLKVIVRRTVEGSELVITQHGVGGIRNEGVSEIKLLLTADAHATLTAAMQLSSKFYVHKKVKSNEL